MPIEITPYLKNAIGADALISGAAGIALMAGSTFLSGRLGLPPELLFWSGVALVPFVIELALILRMRRVAPGIIKAVIALNIAWIAASLYVAFGPSFAPTLFGQIFVVAQAATVALFAQLQIIGLRRASRALG